PACPAASLCSSPFAPREPLAFPTRRSSDLFLAVDGRPRHARGQGGGVQLEVDAHALALGEAEPGVVPVGVDARSGRVLAGDLAEDQKSTRLNSSHVKTSYAVFRWKKKK